MSPISIVLCVLFGIGIVVFLILTFRDSSHNVTRADANILIPFAGYLTPPSDYWNTTPQSKGGAAPTPQGGMYLVGQAGGTAGTPQIQCPVGSKINIVGAYVEVNDPYGECSVNSPSALFSLSCGDSSAVSSAQTCSSDTDCAVGMACSNNRCLPKTCSTNVECQGDGTIIQACPTTTAGAQIIGTPCTPTSQSDPPLRGGGINDTRLVCIPLQDGSGSGKWTFDPAYGQCMMCSTQGKCMNIPMCSGTTNDSGVFQNTRCTQGDCRIRDASSYLAGKCDGKNVCLGTIDDTWLPDSPGGAFGPLPCRSNTTAADYSTLPIIPGWNAGNTPQNGSKPVLANFSQGYYVHGIYTCIPDGELPSTAS